jgi:hypothetical protein
MIADGKQQQMADKVAKLLRQAEDVAGTPEESVFQAKAFEILAKYGIDQATVEAARAGINASELPADAIKLSVQITGTYAAAQTMLVNSVARALHCRCVYSRAGGEHVVHVYGMPHHVDRVRVLWDILRPQMVRQAGTVRPEWGNHVKSYRRAWIAGFASTIGRRIAEQETKAVESAGGGALVLYKSDVQRAELALRKAHPRTSGGRTTSFNTSGYTHGQQDGRRAALAHSLSA